MPAMHRVYDSASTEESSVQLLTTQRFVRSYDSALPLRRACAIGALADLRTAFAQDPRMALRRYNKVKGLEPTLWEMDISGAERLLFHCANRSVVLVDIGGHEVVEHYKRTGCLSRELAKPRPLPPGIDRLANSGFFTFNIEEEWQAYANEAEASWLAYLDKQQSDVATKIVDTVQSVRANPRTWNFSLVLGGPGTGKTSILLNLMTRAIELDIEPRIIVADQVAEIIEAAGIDVETWRVTWSDASRGVEGGILLVDDPPLVEDLVKLKVHAQHRQYAAVIAGVDPLQCAGTPTDQRVKALASGTGSRVFELSVCYRQKRVVGQAALRALNCIAQSSPFLREDKKVAFAQEREAITALSNGFSFANPSGRATVCVDAGVADVRAAVAKLRRAPGLWTWTSPFLIATDDEYLKRIPHGWRSALEELGSTKFIWMSEAEDVKGVEFQHVILILSPSMYQQLEEGFEGATKARYERRRLYRIPLTRAKDSITVFVPQTS